MSMMQMPSGAGMPQGSPYIGARSLFGGMPQSMQGMSMPQMSGSPMGGPSSAGMMNSQGMGTPGAPPMSGGSPFNPAPTGQYPPMLGMGGGSGQMPQMGGGMGQPQINQVGQAPRYNANGPTMDPSRMPWRQPMVGPAQGGAPGLAGYRPQGAPSTPGFGGIGPQKWMGGGGANQQMSPGPVSASPGQSPFAGASQPQQPGGFAGGGNSGFSGGSPSLGGLGSYTGSPQDMFNSMYGPQAQQNATAGAAAQQANAAAGQARQGMINGVGGPVPQTPAGYNPMAGMPMNGATANASGGMNMGAPQGWSPFQQNGGGTPAPPPRQLPPGLNIAGGPRPGMQ